MHKKFHQLFVPFYCSLLFFIYLFTRIIYLFIYLFIYYLFICLPVPVAALSKA